MGICHARVSPDTKVGSWKQLVSYEDAKMKYIAEQSVPKDGTEEHIELRAILDEEVSRHYLELFVETDSQMSGLLQLWDSIEAYKPVTEKKYNKLCNFTDKIRLLLRDQSAPISLRSLQEDIDCLSFLKPPPEKSISFGMFGASNKVAKTNLSNNKTSNNSLSAQDEQVKLEALYTLLHQCIFDCLFSFIFLPFKKSEIFQTMCDVLRESYNSVSVDDFEYITKIGEGGFGLIVHCRKKSTGMFDGDVVHVIQYI